MKPTEDDRRRGPRPGGHGSYRLGGEPATGHTWHQALPPSKLVPVARFDDGVAHRHHEPGDEDPLHNEGVEHEHRDIDVRAVVGSAIILSVVVLVSQVLMYLLFGWFERQAAANDPQISPLAAPATDMPRTTLDSPVFSTGDGGPQLLTNEPMALEKQRDGEHKRLHGYGWADQGGGVAFMPIDEAKKLILQRGLPVRAGEPAAPGLGTRAPALGESSGGRSITMTLPEAPAVAPPASPAPEHAPPSHGEQPPAKPRAPGGH